MRYRLFCFAFTIYFVASPSSPDSSSLFLSFALHFLVILCVVFHSQMSKLREKSETKRKQTKIENENHLNFVFCARPRERVFMAASSFARWFNWIETTQRSATKVRSKHMHKNTDSRQCKRTITHMQLVLLPLFLCVLLHLRLCHFCLNFVCMHGKCTSAVLVKQECKNESLKCKHPTMEKHRSNGAMARDPEQSTILFDSSFNSFIESEIRSLAHFRNSLTDHDVMLAYLLVLFAIQIGHLCGRVGMNGM